MLDVIVELEEISLYIGAVGVVEIVWLIAARHHEITWKTAASRRKLTCGSSEDPSRKGLVVPWW